MSNLEVLGNAQVIKDYIDAKLSEIREMFYALSRETGVEQMTERVEYVLDGLRQFEVRVNGLEDADFNLPSELVVAITEGKSYVKERTEYTLADYDNAVVKVYTVLDIDCQEGYIVIPDDTDKGLFAMKGSDTVFYSEITPCFNISVYNDYGQAYIEGGNFDFNNTCDIEKSTNSKVAFRSAEQFYNYILNYGKFDLLFPEFATDEE